MVGSFSRTLSITINKIIALATIPILTRALGPEQFGTYNLILSIMNFAVIFVNFGFFAYGLREVAKEKSHNTLDEIINSRLLIAIISFVLTNLFLFFFYSKYIQYFILFIATIRIFIEALKVDYYFYAKNQIHLPAISSTIGQLIFAIGVITLIKQHNSLLLLIILYNAYLFIDTFILMYLFTKREKINLKFSFNQSYSLFKKIFNLGTGSKLLVIFNNLPIIVVSYYYSAYQLGIFSAAYKFYSIFTTLIQSVIFPFLPLLVRMKQNRDSKLKTNILRYFIGAILIGFISAIIFGFGSNFIASVTFGNKYNGSAHFITIIGFTLNLILPVYLMTVGIINSFEEDRVFIRGSILSLLILIVFTPVFNNYFNIEGMIYSLFISILTSFFYYQRKLYKTIIPAIVN